MTGMHSNSKRAEFKSELESGGNAVRDLVRGTLQEILEEEMTEALGAAKSGQPSDRLGLQFGPYQFPTHDSVIIPCVLMLRFRCICGAKIVHATRNSRIPRSGCRFELCNPALRPLICGLSGSAEPSAAEGRNAESSVSC